MAYQNRLGDLLFAWSSKLPRWMTDAIFEWPERIHMRFRKVFPHRRKRRVKAAEGEQRKSGPLSRCIAVVWQKAGTWPALYRARQHVAARTCETLGRWAEKAEAAGYSPEANLLREFCRIFDGTDTAHNQATLRILRQPRTPRTYPDIAPESLLWNRWFLEACMRTVVLDLPRTPGPNRKIIKWSSSDDDITAPDINFMSMMQRINLVIIPRGWQILNFRHYGDFELGSLIKPLSRRDFFQFQDQFNSIIEKVDLKLSGCLMRAWSNPEAELDRSDPHEQYERSRLTFGDSNGRPRRHEISRPSVFL